MEERINEVIRLIDIQLSLVSENAIEEQYRARTLASYAQALKWFIDIEKTYKEANNG